MIPRRWDRITLGCLVVIIGCFCGLLFIIARAHAASPPNSDGRYHAFFESLKEPGTRIGCCSISDCRIVKWIQDENGYKILIGEQFGVKEPFWEHVPEDKIIRGIENPLVEPIACVYGGKIHCFIAPPET